MFVSELDTNVCVTERIITFACKEKVSMSLRIASALGDNLSKVITT